MADTPAADRHLRPGLRPAGDRGAAAHGTDTAAFSATVRAALTDLSPNAPADRVWAALGACGALRGLYRRGVVTGTTPHPAKLAALLAAVDARADNGVTLSVLVQVASAIPLLAARAPATGPVRRTLEEALDGKASVALAATDGAAPGSDLPGLATRVQIAPETVVVDGRKRWITTACTAEHLLVLARHRPGRHFTSFTWVLVPAATAGVQVRPAGGDLLGAARTGHIDLTGVRLDADYLVGRPGRGMADFAHHMGTERLAGALWAVALTGRMLRDTRTALTGRTVDGRPLWHNDAVRQRFADCLVRARQLKALCEMLGERITDDHDLVAAALLKAATGPTVDHVLAECAQLRGADGFAPGGVQEVRCEAGVFGIGGGVTGLVLATVADHAETVLQELRS
ncbi:acyl-CoA dehydrogenase family protein [Streptomyces sp. TRM 70361]|uniref:acyl-CoA dehydrogenase family protein n=1 Tax=Streptomyces sp. TRM 70361 TaxID=3116553 RepID=UPI002E7B48ED|nr:acyl-CoA dehydrogenase family protein [Streptomyces sp. TRM 70361]MEE1943037.1 acyl-CoA dehydrogenase family protein [Streptomyces sp. TRM 70361]